MSPCSLWMDCWSSCWLPLDGTLSWYIAWSAAKTHSLTTSNSFSEPFRSDDQSNWGSFLCNSWLTCPAYTSRWFFTGVQKDLDGFLSSPSKAIWALKVGMCSPNSWKNWHLLSQDNVASNMNLGLSLWNTQHKRLQEHWSRLISNLSPRYFRLSSLTKFQLTTKSGRTILEKWRYNCGKKGSASFKAVGERLVLSSNADLAFS